MSKTLNTVKGKSRDYKYNKYLQENGYSEASSQIRKMIAKADAEAKESSEIKEFMKNIDNFLAKEYLGR